MESNWQLAIRKYIKEVLIISRRLFYNKLIDESSIKGDLVLIDGSNTDYITQFGEIYKLYDEDKRLYFKKKSFVNNHNGYVYSGITFKDGINRSRRLHVLLAKAHIPNPNPIEYDIVGHKDNNKTNYNINNLYWTNTSENTKKTYDDGLAKNDIGYDDSQSIPVCCFNLNKELIKEYGSIILASNDLGVSKSTIARQCRHEVMTRPRCGYYFRTQEEYNSFGFI